VWVAGTPICGGACTRKDVRAGVGREQDKKLFVRVTECWLNACESEMSKKSILQRASLRYKDVEQLLYANWNALLGQKLRQYSIFVRVAHWMAFFIVANQSFT